MKITPDAVKMKRWREERSWSQEHLAEAAGISPRTIQRIENGAGASRESVMALAAAFNIDVADMKKALNMVNNDEEKEQAYANRVMGFYIIAACLTFILIFPLLSALKDPSNWGAFAFMCCTWSLIIGYLGWQTFDFESAWKDRIISRQRKH